MKLDQKDWRVLEILKRDSSLTTGQISKQTRIPVTTVHNRIKKLKKEGIVKSCTVEVDYEKLGRPIKAYVLVSVNQSLRGSQEDLGSEIKKIPGVESVDIVTGTTDMIVLVRAESISTLNETVTKKLRSLKGIDKTQTVVVLREV
jgi:DNA-binding Lrp family transcriptional regulator